MSDIKKWYNNYAPLQQKIGVNARHHHIVKWLKKFGLKKEHHVLEIGCGIGTVTGLLAKHLFSSTQITAADISDESIRIARERLKKYKGIKWITGDILFSELKDTFDVIFLPDVLEHIPAERHDVLFNKLNFLLKEDGFILIHIPFPNYLEWCKIHTPETLQVIDQPLHLNLLTEAIYRNHFYIKHIETYSIWMKPADYQVIVLEKKMEKEHFFKDTSFVKKIREKTIR
ncbi:MAG: class I SAM-dependent methyltransferase [Flavobacteriales bacterium]|nr:class I SAM-dependent methyltransferase [Flavobacteriales bacterium]